MLCIVSFLHVLEAIIIDVTSVSGVGDGCCATLSAQSFYRMPAYKTYSSQKVVHINRLKSADNPELWKPKTKQKPEKKKHVIPTEETDEVEDSVW